MPKFQREEEEGHIGGLSLIPGTHMMEVENKFLQNFLWSLYEHHGTNTHTRGREKINKQFNSQLKVLLKL